MDLVSEGFTDFSVMLINSDPSLLDTIKEMKKRMIEMCPNFKNDPIFHDMFPTCARVVITKELIKRQSNTP